MKITTAIIASLAIASTALAAPEVGKPAPGFTLTDCAGNEHSLSDFAGKVVVLEWVNHGCPFVVKHYASGNMQKLQADAADKGVVWLSICSSAPGKQGHMSAADANAKCDEVGSKAAAYLLDEDGTVGQLYGARTTPEMCVINKEGILVYHGAIDQLCDRRHRRGPRRKAGHHRLDQALRVLGEILSTKNLSRNGLQGGRKPGRLFGSLQ